MYYTGSREYNPVNGNFQSKDQYRYMDYQDPMSINLYTYAKGNPLKYLDFDGHESIEEKNNLAEILKQLFQKDTSDTTKKETGYPFDGTDTIEQPQTLWDKVKEFCKDFDPGAVLGWISLGLGGAALLGFVASLLKGTIGVGGGILKELTKDAGALLSDLYQKGQQYLEEQRKIQEQMERDYQEHLQRRREYEREEYERNKDSSEVIRLSSSNIQHIKKHTFDGMLEQAKYLTDTQLANKLEKTSFFNKNWSLDEVEKYTQDAYNLLRKQGKTGLQTIEIYGETINVFIKKDGTFDTAYGVYKYTVDDFR